MRHLIKTFLLTLLLAPAGSLHAGTLQVFLSVQPGSVAEGAAVTVEVLVKNNGALQADSVMPSLQPVSPYPGATGAVTHASGPAPAAASVLAPGASATYTWTWSATACGDAAFSATASGSEAGTGNPLSANEQVSTLFILCATPTATPTPWIIYETPTPPPVEAEAGVRGNVFRPGAAPMELDFAVGLDGRVTITIFDRNGRVVRVMQHDVSAGRHTRVWDGRNDAGNPVASGIYVVHFQGRGLNARSKIAVLR